METSLFNLHCFHKNFQYKIVQILLDPITSISISYSKSFKYTKQFRDSVPRSRHSQLWKNQDLNYIFVIEKNLISVNRNILVKKQRKKLCRKKTRNILLFGPVTEGSRLTRGCVSASRTRTS